ncbi:hypothetical protein ACN27G_21430 [Plantactinospora sp. WMMB334]|uniref:hypothetical protein n=1 Tax=Plantactinospora sp. WMMB334 TaxID=3404119 RepID=UPI003B956445
MPAAACAAMTLVAAVATVVTSAAPASAATGCAGTDPYTRRVVTPANASGGANVAGARFGAAVVTADFNKDGYADVAVGAPGDTIGGVASGTVSVFPGSASGPGAGVRLTQTNLNNAANEAGDQFGATLAAGDFNKDGYPDLAVGIPGEAIGTIKAGALGVFYGKAAGLTTGTWYDQEDNGGSNEAGDQFGTALAAGDFNRDGFADLAVGLPNEGPDGSSVRGGDVAVFKGAAGGIASGWWVHQSDVGGANEAGDRFGAALAAGNVTGSAHTDLVIGAPGEGPDTSPANSGAIYVMPGAADGTGTGFGRNQNNNGGSNEAGDNLGAALAVGDFDADGFADIAAGLPGEAPGDAPAAGSVLVYPGASANLGTGYWLQLGEGGETLVAGDRFGGALATGDTNQDGHDDLLVGVGNKSYPGVSRAGAAVLFTGRARVGDATRALRPARRIVQSDLNAANETNDGLGTAVALGDVTGDGRADGVIGAPGEAGVGQPASGATVVLGTLVPTAASGLPIAQFSATTAGQATPVPPATLGPVDYAYADNIGRLLHGHQADPDSALSVQWTAIHGQAAFTGRPALAEQADGRLQIAALNASGDLWVRTQATRNPPAWGSWTDLDGPVGSPPVLARQADGALVMFAVDAAGALWALAQQGANGAYSAWLGLGVGGLTGPVAAAPVSGGVQIFARDTAGQLRTMRYAAGAVTGCAAIGDSTITGIPAVVTYPGNRLRVVARAVDGTVVTMMQDSGGNFPATWTPVGDFSADGPPGALIDPVSGKIQVVARGSDGGVYGTGELTQGSGTWTDWTRLTFVDEVAATDPTVFTFTGFSGPTWAFVFRNGDNQTRVYQPSSAGARGGRATGSTGGPAFTGRSLPAPPA